MKVFTKLRRYEIPGNSNDHQAEIATQSKFIDPGGSLGIPPSKRDKPIMWVTTSQTDTTLWTKCLRHIHRHAEPTLRTCGQCMFCFAMLLVLSGIALCIWGFVGEPIYIFQIVGPTCIGCGFLIYFLGCMLCYRKHPQFERSIRIRSQNEKTRQIIDFLKNKDAVEIIQNGPNVLEDFREIASKIIYSNQ